ncbi:protein of unknown function [Burkholderia multivorans]
MQLHRRRRQTARLDYAYEGFHQLEPMAGAVHRRVGRSGKPPRGGRGRAFFGHARSV